MLWAVAEALAIPTYSHPRLSIPSGIIGIPAGLVPSLFAVYAVRSASGSHYQREDYPNMLSKFYNFPMIPRLEYPESVWAYLNEPPPGGTTRTRRQIMLDHWEEDKNLRFFNRAITRDRLVILTGQKQPSVDIDLLNDRITMLREVKAVTLQMSRPLLELVMIVRDKKHLAPAEQLH